MATACAASRSARGLVAEDPEGQHRDADGAVLGDDRGDQPTVGGNVIGVEFPGVHPGRPRLAQGGRLGVEPVGATCGQHHRRPRGQAPREFDADLAAPAENYHRTRARVVHGCDYHLR